MRKMGGFFIWLSFLFLSCVDSINSNGVISDTKLQNNGSSNAKDEESETENVNSGKKEPWDYRQTNYQNNDLGFRLSYPNSWNFLETGDVDSGLVLMMGNFDFDGLYHPKENEISVEGLYYDNPENIDLWNFAILKRPNFRGMLVNYEISDESLRLLFDCIEMPEDYQGEWMSGYVEDYYFAKDDRVYFFSASVLERDAIFLAEFETMMASFEFYPPSF